MATARTLATLAGRTWRPPLHKQAYTGVAVFLAGLKKGRVVTFTFAFSRIASIVISICSGVPGLEYSVSRLASEIIFFSVGDHVVVVALPTCLSAEYTGTATREACAGGNRNRDPLGIRGQLFAQMQLAARRGEHEFAFVQLEPREG